MTFTLKKTISASIVKENSGRTGVSVPKEQPPRKLSGKRTTV
jgi:hypothetical protein